MKKILQRTEAFLKKNQTAALLTLIVIIGSFFRLYDFSDLVRFNTDQVRDVLVVEDILEGKELPLLGPKAGGTTFKLGPAFYHLEAFSGIIFGNNPSGMALFVGILSVASIPLLFLFLRYYFSIHITLLLTLLYSFSFYTVKYSRFAWNPNIIPFFFFLFLLSILKIVESRNKKIGIWHIILAASMGIGVQLHTLLLIIMPLLLAIAYAYMLFRKKIFHLASTAITIAIILLLNLPFFIYDFQNNGKNIKSFFAGTQKKTEKNLSLIDNILKDGQFFIQGTVYSGSSFEPQKNWIKAKKLLNSKKNGEIAAAFIGTVFFIFGMFLFIKKLLSEKDEKKKVFLALIFSTISLSFLILLPIANELNIRYFIILIFLPYILLGFFVEFLLKNIPKKISIGIIFLITLFLIVLNTKTYTETYNLENYSTRSSLYGGISVKESRDISNFMLGISKTRSFPERMLFPSSFKFSPSIKYFNDKKELKFIESSKQNQYSDLVFFSISDQKDVDRTLEEKKGNFILIDSMKTGRFTIFAFEKK